MELVSNYMRIENKNTKTRSIEFNPPLRIEKGMRLELNIKSEIRYLHSVIADKATEMDITLGSWSVGIIQVKVPKDLEWIYVNELTAKWN